MSRQEDLRKEILEKVKEFYQAGEQKTFVPGETLIPYSGRIYDEQEMVNLVDSALDFWLTTGRFASEFEERYAQFLGVKCALLTNSGSSANLLAMSALTSPLLGGNRLKSGDEVITAACGFPTTLNPILQNGLKPVFIDVELGTYNIDLDQVEKAISPKTRAIFIAHTLGNIVDIDRLQAICKKHRLWFIEDNCDALGGTYKGQLTGSFGDIATGSFYASHHMTMGEGGAVVTSNPTLKRILVSFRDWGRDCWCGPGHDDSCKQRFSQQHGKLPFGYDHKYVFSHIGYNLKMTDMQPAIGLAQLKKLPGFVKARQENFKLIYEALKSFEDVLILPRWEKDAQPSWFGFPIFVKEDAPFSRDEMVQFLESKKIMTRMMFGGNLIKQPAYLDMDCRIVGKLENTDRVMNQLLWIGVYPGLTAEKLTYVMESLTSFLNAAKATL